MKKKRGVTILEFSLAGIPALFVFISTIEMALGMWQYHTLGYAMKDATRTIISRGQGCQMTGNSCGSTIGALGPDRGYRDRDSGIHPQRNLYIGKRNGADVRASDVVPVEPRGLAAYHQQR